MSDDFPSICNLTCSSFIASLITLISLRSFMRCKAWANERCTWNLHSRKAIIILLFEQRDVRETYCAMKLLRNRAANWCARKILSWRISRCQWSSTEVYKRETVAVTKELLWTLHSSLLIRSSNHGELVNWLGVNEQLCFLHQMTKSFYFHLKKAMLHQATTIHWTLSFHSKW